MGFPVQPLNVEQLPLASHRQRGPALGSRKRQMTKGALTRSHIQQPNVPPPVTRPGVTQSEPIGGTGEPRSATSPFLHRATIDELPNMPVHEKVDVLHGEEETTSFHDEEADTTSSEIVSPKKVTSAGIVRRKTTSPPSVKVDLGRGKKTRASLDHGKRTKKKF